MPERPRKPFDPSVPREAIWEDFEFDPTHKRKLMVARYLVGMLLNQMRGCRPMFAPVINDGDLADQAEALGRRFGLIAKPDGLKHAPACPANLWAGMNLPSGPCSCGAWYYEEQRLKAVARGEA